MRASKSRGVLSALIRPARWFCVCNLLVTALAAQCTNPTQIPNQTISSGNRTFSDNNALEATGVTINGSASVTFVAGNCIHLGPGFRATAGTAPTTFHAWVETAPSAVSFSPSGSSGLTQQFTFTTSSPSGCENLSEIYALFNTLVSGSNACYIRYNRGYNLLYLADNSGSVWSSGIVPGGAGSASNSYCSINGIGSSFGAAGNQLTVTVAVTFQMSFSGAKNEYLIAYDNQGLNSAWQPKGTWTVPGGDTTPPVISNLQQSPASNSATITWATNELADTQIEYGTTPSYGSWTALNSTLVTSHSQQVTGLAANTTYYYRVRSRDAALNLGTATGSFTTAGPGPDFTLDLPTSVQVEAGFQNSLRLRITPQGGFSAPVAWTLAPGVAGVTTVTALHSQLGLTTATGTLYALPEVIPGAYSLTVTAVGGGKSHSANITMQVLTPYRSQSETNMAFVDFLTYDNDNNHVVSDSLPVLKQTCDIGAGIRACYQQIMDQYRAQQISGVRVMFSLSNAIVYSTGAINQTWLTGLRAFLEDLYSRQIYRITPTPSWDHPSFDGPYTYASPAARAGCTDPGFYDETYIIGDQMYRRTVTQVRFNRTAPFGEGDVRVCTIPQNDCTDGWQVDGAGRIAAYQCAMANPNFVGWERMNDVIDAILLAIRDNFLTVQEFDVTNEIELPDLPVRARLIVDNTNKVPNTNDDVDVLGTVGSGRRSLRQSTYDHGFDPGRVTYSAIGSLSQQPLGECPVTNPPYFGDSARISDLSLLTGVIGVGGPVGIAWTFDLPPDDWRLGTALPCGGSTAGAATLSYTHVQPAVIDVHNGPCVVVKRTGTGAIDDFNGWGECDPAQWGNLAGEARAMGNALAAFQDSFRSGGWHGFEPNLANALVILGETHGRVKPGDPAIQNASCKVQEWSPDFTACSMGFRAEAQNLPPEYSYVYKSCWKVSAGQDTYNGFNTSSLGTRTRPNLLPATIVFRPWEYLQQSDEPQATACNAVNTNPPYNPAP